MADIDYDKLAAAIEKQKNKGRGGGGNNNQNRPGNQQRQQRQGNQGNQGQNRPRNQSGGGGGRGQNKSRDSSQSPGPFNRQRFGASNNPGQPRFFIYGDVKDKVSTIEMIVNGLFAKMVSKLQTRDEIVKRIIYIAAIFRFWKSFVATPQAIFKGFEAVRINMDVPKIQRNGKEYVRVDWLFCTYIENTDEIKNNPGITIGFDPETFLCRKVAHDGMKAGGNAYTDNFKIFGKYSDPKSPYHAKLLQAIDRNLAGNTTKMPAMRLSRREMQGFAAAQSNGEDYDFYVDGTGSGFASGNTSGTSTPRTETTFDFD